MHKKEEFCLFYAENECVIGQNVYLCRFLLKFADDKAEGICYTGGEEAVLLQAA